MIFIILIFFTAFLLEGSGLFSIRQNITYFYCILPAILYIHTVQKGRQITIPFKATLIFLAFLFFSTVSSIAFSVDKQISLEYLLFYVVSYLVFLFFYNHKAVGEKLIEKIPIISGIFFITLFLFSSKPISFSHGYQFVISYFSSHNHLGDLLGLVLIVAGYRLLETRKLIYLFFSLISLPFFLISFSRTAYVSLLVAGTAYVLFLANKKVCSVLKIGLAIIASIVILFFLVSVKEAQTSPVFRPINQYLIKTFSLQPKEFFGGREEYVSQILHSFYEKPFFGFGPGNFASASRQYQSNPFNWTETAHNIFLETLVENGLLALLAFSYFIYLLMRSVLRKHSLFGLILIYLLLNFQADYTYRIYSFFIFFMIVAATVYQEEEHRPGTLFFGILSLIPLFFVVLSLGSNLFFMARNYKQALYTNPFNKKIYPLFIEEEQKVGNYRSVVNLTNMYQWIAPYDLTQFTFSANLYEGYGEKAKALSMYKQIYAIDPYGSFQIPAIIYRLLKEEKSPDKARVFIQEALEKYRKYKYLESYRKEVLQFCSQYKEINCKQMGQR
ncbi:O-antigen ligase family protein [Candidatus Roizmanbacteria bacterium]|nr:O-antigen ligase family protein [Candidatus Roizmanbacteria bacterium]